MSGNGLFTIPQQSPQIEDAETWEQFSDLHTLIPTPRIVATGDFTQQHAQINVCNYTPPLIGTFEIGGYMSLNSISGGTTPIIFFAVSFTDQEEIFHDEVSLFGTNFSTGNVAAGLSVAGQILSYFTHSIREFANFAITISTVIIGSPTTINYDVGGHIKQIS